MLERADFIAKGSVDKIRTEIKKNVNWVAHFIIGLGTREIV